MVGYTYQVNGVHGNEKADVCTQCVEKLGLPTEVEKREVRVIKQEHSLYRPDSCIGCGRSVSSLSSQDGVPFDGDKQICDGFDRLYNINTPANALCTILNESANLNVFSTYESSKTEKIILAEDDDNEFASFNRPVADASKMIHILVLNDSQAGREAMESRCEKLCRLLKINGFDGAPKPTDKKEDYPDWEIFAIPFDS